MPETGPSFKREPSPERSGVETDQGEIPDGTIVVLRDSPLARVYLFFRVNHAGCIVSLDEEGHFGVLGNSTLIPQSDRRFYGSPVLETARQLRERLGFPVDMP